MHDLKYLIGWDNAWFDPTTKIACGVGSACNRPTNESVYRWCIYLAFHELLMIATNLEVYLSPFKLRRWGISQGGWHNYVDASKVEDGCVHTYPTREHVFRENLLLELNNRGFTKEAHIVLPRDVSFEVRLQRLFHVFWWVWIFRVLWFICW